MAELIDPTTNRLAVTGPKGEGALAPGDPRIRTTVGLVQGTTPDGRTVFYVPGQNIQPGNVAALEAYRKASAEEKAKNTAAAGDPEGAARASGFLRQHSLEGLSTYVDQIARGLLTWAELEVMLNDHTTEPGRIVDEMYPELRMLREAKKPPTSIAAIQEYRTRARSLMRAANLPEGFYDDPRDFTDFIVKGVDITELGERVQGYVAAAYEAPEEFVSEMQRLHGISREGLAAYWMDEDRALPALQKQAKAVSASAGAVKAGFGGLTATEADMVAGAGLTGGAAVDAFGDLVAAGELFGSLPGFEEDEIDRQEQLGFITGDAKAAAKVRRKAETRAAETVGGGGFAAGQGGFSGFGTAR